MQLTDTTSILNLYNQKILNTKPNTNNGGNTRCSTIIRGVNSENIPVQTVKGANSHSRIQNMQSYSTYLSEYSHSLTMTLYNLHAVF